MRGGLWAVTTTAAARLGRKLFTRSLSSVGARVCGMAFAAATRIDASASTSSASSRVASSLRDGARRRMMHRCALTAVNARAGDEDFASVERWGVRAVRRADFDGVVRGEAYRGNARVFNRGVRMRAVSCTTWTCKINLLCVRRFTLFAFVFLCSLKRAQRVAWIGRPRRY